jgi:hypothetical protein
MKNFRTSKHKNLYLINFTASRILWVTLLGLFIWFHSVNALGAQSVTSHKIANLFKPVYSPPAGLSTSLTISSDPILELNRGTLDSLFQVRPEHLVLQFPMKGNESMSMILHRVEKNYTNIGVKTSSGIDTFIQSGLHYWGQTQGGDANSVSISFFDSGLMGFIQDSIGQKWTLGSIGTSPDFYSLHLESNLNEPLNFDCQTNSSLDGIRSKDIGLSSLRSGIIVPTNKTVRLYLECEYELYQQKGSLVNVTNYITGLFNEVARIYQAEGISMDIAQLFIWNSADSYPTNALDALNTFKAQRPTYTGNLAHLITVRSGPSYSGIAFVSGFCNSFGYGYSQIQGTYQTYPTYSWSVNVLAHELGHNFGSRHTHDCVWNGNNTAIDGCGPAVGSPTTGCATLPAPTPPYKGTIMSYCHSVSGIGIDLALGFGEQPGNLIRAAVNGAACLACDVPVASALSVQLNGSNGATLSCSTQGVNAYDWRYRLVGASFWVDVNFSSSNTITLTSLSSGSTYEYQSSVQCAAGSWSDWSAIKTFALPASPQDTDMGGVNDAQELINGTNPNDPGDDLSKAALQLKVLLQGALLGTTNGIMRDDLRTGAYLPTTDPYTGTGARFTHAGTGAGVVITNAILNTNAGTVNAIVDWVFVELRSSSNPATIVETRVALLQRDGDVVSAEDGINPLRFAGTLPGQSFYVAVKHRNHLGVMSAQSILLSSLQTNILDFRTITDDQVYDRPGTINYNGAEMARFSITSTGGEFQVGTTVNALWAGNTNNDSSIKYQGNGNDLLTVLSVLINDSQNTSKLYNYSLTRGYFASDVNLDGAVKYQGGSNESIYILATIQAYPVNSGKLYNFGIMIEQLP